MGWAFAVIALAGGLQRISGAGSALSSAIGSMKIRKVCNGSGRLRLSCDGGYGKAGCVPPGTIAETPMWLRIGSIGVGF